MSSCTQMPDDCRSKSEHFIYNFWWRIITPQIVVFLCADFLDHRKKICTNIFILFDSHIHIWTYTIHPNVLTQTHIQKQKQSRKIHIDRESRTFIFITMNARIFKFNVTQTQKNKLIFRNTVIEAIEKSK